jgi:hypothetical protein
MNLTGSQREVVINFISEQYLDSMSMKDLEVYFQDTQADLLDGYSDEELLSALSELADDELIATLTKENV